MDNIETVEILGRMQEEIIKACESYVYKPNTEEEQERMKKMTQRLLVEQLMLDVR